MLGFKVRCEKRGKKSSREAVIQGETVQAGTMNYDRVRRKEWRVKDIKEGSTVCDQLIRYNR